MCRLLARLLRSGPNIQCTQTALPEGTKVAVYDALNTRAQAEAMLGCDDVTARIFYKRAAGWLPTFVMLSWLRHASNNNY